MRELHDSYLYFIDTQFLVETHVEPSFSISFASSLNIFDIYRKNKYTPGIYSPTLKIYPLSQISH